ncbi:Uncharacterised protein [Mycolicibacterium vanbaalenii]|uniref:Uncharacterized protein n=1 Tax=Mycolicibacterium vanbaalenii TaxID=110539 RepID=A0A5S9RA21_MYCVN|nr:hypothetical protein [Mycolicibacterium vanbaalenii]CAA0138234.1 Uncharacterised protein [Mycolicibacterium vanbaalenii]
MTDESSAAVPDQDHEPHIEPVEGAGDELVVAAQPEGVLVSGDPAVVELYISRIQESAGHAIQVFGVDKTSATNAAGIAAGAAAALGQSAKFVQLHPESLAAIQRGNLINGTDGFYRMMTRGADMKFTKQLQWKPANLGPARLMSMQMVAVQIALKTAISEVENAVERVESKVDEVLRLAQATRSGDILGDRTSVERMVTYLEKHGSFSDTDWEWISAIGPGLNRTVEQLRQHALGTLKSFDPSRPIQDRADFVVNAVERQQLGETLSLLVVAEETLFKWQRLRIARVEATEPQHLQKVLDDARELLAHQLAADADVYRRAQEVLNAVSKTEAIDGLRFWSVQDLNRDLPKLREDLDRFAQARRTQVLEWSSFEAPTPIQAVQAAAEFAGEKATMAISAASKGYTTVSDFLTKSTRTRAAIFRKRKSNENDADETSQLDMQTPDETDC